MDQYGNNLAYKGTNGGFYGPAAGIYGQVGYAGMNQYGGETFDGSMQNSQMNGSQSTDGFPNQVNFKNVELRILFADLRKNDPVIQTEAARKLQQYLAQYQEDCDDNLFDQFKIMLESKKQEQVIGALMAINRVTKIGRETRIVHRVKRIMPVV